MTLLRNRFGLYLNGQGKQVGLLAYAWNRTSGPQQQNQDPQPNFQYGPRTTFKNKERCPAHFPTFLTKRLHCPPWSCLISLLEP